MYADYFGLRALPFEDRANAWFTFLTADHEDALTAIEYDLQKCGSVAMVLGEEGIGKTQFIRTFSARMQKPDQLVVLTCPASGQRNLLREVCKGFGVPVTSAKGGASRRIERLHHHLERVRASKNRCVLIVDQAENLSAENLTQMGALVNLKHGPKHLLSVILTGRPRLRATLDDSQFAGLIQHLTSEHRLRPLSQEQTTGYIRHRLANAGCQNNTLIDSDAIEWIYSRTLGVPRAINTLCHQAMLAACEAGETQVDRETLARLKDVNLAAVHTTEIETLGTRSEALNAPTIGGPQTGPSVRPPSTSFDQAEDGASLCRPATTGAEQHHAMDNESYAGTPLPNESDFDPEIGAPAHWCVERTSDRSREYDYSAIHPTDDLSGQEPELSPRESLFTRVEQFVRGLHAENIAAVQAELDTRWQAMCESIEPALRLMQSLYECRSPEAEVTVADVETRIANINEQLAQTISQIEKLEGTCRDRMVAVCQAVVEEQRTALKRSIHEIVEAARKEVKTSCARASDFVCDAEARMGRMRLDIRDSLEHWERVERERDGRATTNDPAVTTPGVGAKKPATRPDIITRPFQDRAATVNERGDSAAHTGIETPPEAASASAQFDPAAYLTNDLIRKLDSHHAAASATLKALAAATIEARRLIEEMRSVDSALRQRRKECEQVIADADCTVTQARTQTAQLQKACAVADRQTNELTRSTGRAGESLIALEQASREKSIALSARQHTPDTARLGQPAQTGGLKRFGQTTQAAKNDSPIEQDRQADTTAHPASPRARG